MSSLVEEQLNIIDIVNERVEDIKLYKDFYENPKLTKAQQKYNKGFLIEVFNSRMMYCNPKEYKEYIKLYVNLFVLNNDIEIDEGISFSGGYSYGHNIRDKLTNIILCKIYNDDYTDNVSKNKINDNELRINYKMDFYNSGVLYNNKFIKYDFMLRIAKLNELKNNKILTIKNKTNYYSLFTREIITKMLENDDVELLIKILSHPSSNTENRFLVYYDNIKRERQINLIELIIAYSAIKCFKYLILNKYLDSYIEKIDYEKSVMRCIIVSNNCEILHLFENNYKSHIYLYQIMDTAIYYHRNEFLSYMLNKCANQQEIHEHDWIMDMLDYCLYNYNYKALLTLLNEVGEQVSITKAIMKRNDSYSSDYDFHSKFKYAVPLAAYVLDNYNFSLFTDWSYVIEYFFVGIFELDFIKRLLYSVKIKDIRTIKYKGYAESFIKAFSTCIINDVPDEYIKLLKSVYYGKEFLTIEELNNIELLPAILKEILNRKPKITHINYNKLITHIVPEIVKYNQSQLIEIVKITSKQGNKKKIKKINGLEEIVKEYFRRMII